MGLETKDRTIGDTTYYVTQMPSSRARKLLVRLFKIIGPTIGALTEGSTAGKISEIKVKVICDVLASVAANMGDDDLEFFVREILTGGFVKYATASGQPTMSLEVAEIHFVGKTHDLLRLIGFALEVNFGGFFGEAGLGGVLRRSTPPASTSSSSPAT